MHTNKEAVITVKEKGELVAIIYRHERSSLLYKCTEMTEGEVAELLVDSRVAAE
jgi:hypothetical protein